MEFDTQSYARLAKQFADRRREQDRLEAERANKRIRNERFSAMVRDEKKALGERPAF